MVGLDDLCDLVVDPQDSLSLLVRLGQSGFELLMGGAQPLKHTHTSANTHSQTTHTHTSIKTHTRTSKPPISGADLDLLDGMDDEGVLQVLHGALHPVVERRRSLGKLQVQLVDGLQQLLGSLFRRRARDDGTTKDEGYV